MASGEALMTHSLQSADQQLPFWWDLQVLQKHGPCCDVYSAVRAANWINPAGTASYAKYYLRTVWVSQVVRGVKSQPANAGDGGSIPGSGRSPGGENGNPL